MGVAQTAVSPVALAEDFPAEVVSPVVEAVEAAAVPSKYLNGKMEKCLTVEYFLSIINIIKMIINYHL